MNVFFLLFSAIGLLALNFYPALSALKKHPMVDAIKAAKCARSAEKDALKHLSGAISGEDKVTAQTRATRQLEAYGAKERDGVRKCLTEDEVYELGWFSYFEGEAQVIGDCSLFPTRALDKHTEDNGDTDLLSAAANWAAFPEEAHRAEHPYYAGQDAARQKFEEAVEAHQYDAVCRDMFAGFGPNGDRFAGLVSRTKQALEAPAFASAPPPTENELRFLALYREFQHFRDGTDFKRCGFAACGHPEWLASAQTLWHRDVELARNERMKGANVTGVLVRCDGVLSADLFNLADRWINPGGEKRSPSDLHYIKQKDAEIAGCADKIEVAIPKH